MLFSVGLSGHKDKPFPVPCCTWAAWRAAAPWGTSSPGSPSSRRRRRSRSTPSSSCRSSPSSVRAGHHGNSSFHFEFHIYVHLKGMRYYQDNICVQGGPTEIYSGNWSIFYAVWEISFYFLYVSPTDYNTYISGVKCSWTSLYTYINIDCTSPPCYF